MDPTVTYFPGQNFGQVVMSGATTTGMYTGSGVDGTIALNFTPTTQTSAMTGNALYGTGTGAQTGTMTFGVTLSQQKQTLVMTEVQALIPTTSLTGSTLGTLSQGTTASLTSIASEICIISAAGNLNHEGNHLYGGAPGGTVDFYFYIPSLMSTGGITTSINPSTLSGASLYSLNKIVVHF
jgi:hypothetical protein